MDYLRVPSLAALPAERFEEAMAALAARSVEQAVSLIEMEHNSSPTAPGAAAGLAYSPEAAGLDLPAFIPQRSDGWRRARLGKVTDSRMADLTARTKTGWSASRGTYLNQLQVERLNGAPSLTPQTPVMRWGVEQEPLARAAYSFRTDRDALLAGFVEHPLILMSGASPDLRDGPTDAPHTRDSANSRKFNRPFWGLSHRHQHRRQHSGSEAAYWEELGVDPHQIAKALWDKSPNIDQMQAVLRGVALDIATSGEDTPRRR